MTNINIELSGYLELITNKMVKEGYVKTKSEAVRLALYDFEQRHELLEDELYLNAADRIIKKIHSGLEPVKKFNIKELD